MTAAEMSIAKKVTDTRNQTSLGTAALVAGVGLLIMAIAAAFSKIYRIF